MKTTFSIILFFVLSNLYGQNFAPNSAVWNYTYNWLFFNMGYMKLTVIGDTLIQGKSCKIIQKRNIGHNSQYNTNYDLIDGYEYVYSDTDKVYFYRFNKFYTLYDFGASPGTSWIIACENYLDHDSLSKIIVDSVEIETINSVNLRTLYLHTDSGTAGFLGMKMVEKIGCLNWMFPVNLSLVGPDYPEPLRCYYDNSLGLIKYILVSCDTLYNGLYEVKNYDNKISFYPNPVNSISTLEWDGKTNENCTLYIYNYLGNLIKTVKTNSQSIEIRNSDFVKGIYFYRLASNREQIGIGQFEIN